MADMRKVSGVDLGLLVIRLGIGGFFVLFFGLQKIKAGPQMWEGLGKALGPFGIHFWPTFWGFMATMGEFGGGLLFLLGIFFRPGCALLLCVMTVATVTVFPKGMAGGAFTPICVGITVLGLLLAGPGAMSLKQLVPPLRNKWFG